LVNWFELANWDPHISMPPPVILHLEAAPIFPVQEPAPGILISLMLNHYFLGQYIMTNTPMRAIKLPIRSNLSGAFLSIPQPHRTDMAIKTPP
jgi:hypothetical protein